MKMLSKIILCATNSKLTAGVWRFGKLQSYQLFQNDAQGQEDFGAFLQKNSNIKIYLIADAIEEDYRLETLPHTSGGARRELVERKLSQLYRGTVYRVAHFIMREKERRKDDRFLFVSLNNADFLQGWVRRIEELQAPLVGVYLLPMISQQLVRRLKIMSPHILLTEQLTSGLRQTYMHNGRLRMSRLAPYPASMQNKLSYFYTAETEKTRLYLNSQRFISRETALNVVLPILDENGQQLCRDIERQLGLECTAVDLAQFARGLRIAPELLHTNPELFHMHWLAMGNVPDNLAPPSQVKNHWFNLIRQTILLASLAVVLGGLGITAVDLKSTFDQSRLLEQAISATHEQERLYNGVAKNFPTTPIPSVELKLAVELAQKVTSLAQPPDHMLQTISQALEVAPEIQINRLRWVLTNDVEQKDDEQTSASNTSPQPPSAKVTPPAFVAEPGAMYELGFINGEIKGFNGDYRTALEAVNHFAERLRADHSVAAVSLLQSPVNVSSYSSLQGSTTDERTAQRAVALFKLKVILKREIPEK